jgi:hypothetical protein
VSDLFDEPDDATPLTAEERRALIPAHIAYRSELNEAEQENIMRAQDWAFAARRRDPLTEKFIKELHRRMLRDPWRTREEKKGVFVRLRLGLIERSPMRPFRPCGDDSPAGRTRFHFRGCVVGFPPK